MAAAWPHSVYAPSTSGITGTALHCIPDGKSSRGMPEEMDLVLNHREREMRGLGTCGLRCEREAKDHCHSDTLVKALCASTHIEG